MMKISGTYLDRLFLVILPLMLFLSVIFYLKGDDIGTILTIGLGFSSLLWVFDSITLALKKIKPLYLKETIYIGDRKVDIQSIIKVIPFLDKRLRWDFRTIEIQILNEGRIEKFRVMAKPVFFVKDIMGKQSSTIRILIERFPELKDKISEEVRE